ncbi:MAG: outer membrane lipid asymmetry maintenance protein MlaD [Shimia sp.]
MRENLVEVLTGAAVLAIAVAFIVFATGREALGTGGGYPLTASFRSADGIAVGSDVRLAGVKVGSVTGMRLDPATFRAEMEIVVQEAYRVPDDSSLLISSEGLLGGNFVEIQPGGSPFELEPGDAFTDTQGSVSLITLLTRFVGGGAGE